MIKQYKIMTLITLRQARENLIKNLIDENSDIYYDMFKYEHELSTMSFCIDKFFSIWLDEHWKLFDKVLSQYCIEEHDKEFAIDYFSKAFIKLLNNFDLATINSDDSDFSRFVIQQKREFIEKLIIMGEKTTTNINWLIYKSEKSRRLFERQLNYFINYKK